MNFKDIFPLLLVVLFLIGFVSLIFWSANEDKKEEIEQNRIDSLFYHEKIDSTTTVYHIHEKVYIIDKNNDLKQI